MVDRPQDSIQLMKKIMDVQEELDRFRSGSSSRNSSVQKSRGHQHHSHHDKRQSPKAGKSSEHKHRSTKENHKLDIKVDYQTDNRFENIHVSSTKAKQGKLSSSAGPEGHPYDSQTHQNKEYQSKRPPPKPYKHAMEQLKDITKEISNEIHKHHSNYRSSAGSTPYNENEMSVNKSKHNHSSLNQSGLNYSALNHSEYVPEKNSKRGTPKNDGPIMPAKAAFSHLLNKVNAINFISQREIENDAELESIIRGASNHKSPGGSSAKRNKSGSARSEKLASPCSYKKIHEEQLNYKIENSFRKKLEFVEEKKEKKERPQSIESKQRPSSSSRNENKCIFEIPSSILQANRFYKEDDNKYKTREPSEGKSLREMPPEIIPPKAVLNQPIFKGNYEKKALEIPMSDKGDKNDTNAIIVELKNKIHAKELEIIDLKNSRLQNDMENQNLLLQIKDQLTDNKRNEELIEKLRQQCAMQEKEIDILRKTKKILEGNKLDMEQVAESQLVKKLEHQLEEKRLEIMQLHEQLTKLKTEKKQIVEEERNRCFNEVERLKEELVKKETDLRKALFEIEGNKDKMQEYAIIDKKIVELEEFQNKLIEENDQLKMILTARVKPLKELERLGENIDRELITSTISMRRKLNESEELSKSLINMLKAAIKDQELPIEILLKHNRAKGKEKAFNEHELKALTLKELTHQNLNMCEGINRFFQSSMDQICDDYAAKYGNQCNVQ